MMRLGRFNVLPDRVPRQAGAPRQSTHADAGLPPPQYLYDFTRETSLNAIAAPLVEFAVMVVQLRPRVGQRPW